MMLIVYMNGVRCGAIEQDARGDVSFVYDENYRAGTDPTPLSLSMPLALRRHRKRAIVPFLDGLITDKATARQATATRFGVSANKPVALLSHIGADVAGALQVLPDGVDSTDAGTGTYRLLSDEQVGGLLRGAIEEYRDGRSAGAGGRFSLAGAQPKIALLRTQRGRWAEAEGATPTTHILKPVAGEYRRLDIVEHLTMQAAAVLGLGVARSTLATFDGQATFVVERYDRRRSGTGWIRLHQEDLGQALGVAPTKKYQRDDGGPGVAEIARLCAGLPNMADRSAVAEAFFRALMFNTVAMCTDAHVKNYSLLLEADRVRLAPLYDLATFAPYQRPGAVIRSAMKVGGEYRFSAIGPNQCLAAARQLGVDLDLAAGIIQDLRKGMVGAFEHARDNVVTLDPRAAEFAGSVVDAVATLPLVTP